MSYLARADGFRGACQSGEEGAVVLQSVPGNMNNDDPKREAVEIMFEFKSAIVRNQYID